MLGQVGIAHTVHVNVSYALGLNTPFQTLGLPAARGCVDFRLVPSVHCLGCPGTGSPSNLWSRNEFSLLGSDTEETSSGSKIPIVIGSLDFYPHLIGSLDSSLQWGSFPTEIGKQASDMEEDSELLIHCVLVRVMPKSKVKWMFKVLMSKRWDLYEGFWLLLACCYFCYNAKKPS